MDELDRLERLNKLRESGALTSDEFEKQKARILEGRPSAGLRMGGLWVAVGVLALCVVVASVGFYVGTSIAQPPRKHERVEVQAAAQTPAPEAETNSQ